jgi:hypothetical protein
MKTIFFSLSLLCTFSCTRIVFDLPQPQNAPSIAGFPPKYQGIYLHEEGDRDTVIITMNSVTFIEYSDKELTMRALDTLPNIYLKGDLLFDKHLPALGGVPYTVEDTVLYFSHVQRFVIGLSDTVVVKQMKKCLVVSANFKDDDVDYWDVYLTRMTKGGDLIVRSVGNLRTPDLEGHSGEYDGELDDFAKISQYERIAENTYLFRPTPSQFQKLIKKRLFSQTETYKRIR